MSEKRAGFETNNCTFVTKPFPPTQYVSSESTPASSQVMKFMRVVQFSRLTY